MDGEEAYLLLLLSDSNLPTGSFIASSGLESFATHGFLSPASPHDPKPMRIVAGQIADFVQDSLSTYGRIALPFMTDAHEIIRRLAYECPWDTAPSGDRLHESIRDISAVDELYETTTLNHVTRRASVSQGVALLTLYSKGYVRPDVQGDALHGNDKRDTYLAKVVDELKLSIRRELTPGHLPVCWGVLTGALGLSLERSQFLHLFLHARGLLSAAVRMNSIGPYGAQQLLLHTIRPLVEHAAESCSHLRTGLTFPVHDDARLNTIDGPSMIWPLGEILAGRHDLQHSRVFNS